MSPVKSQPVIRIRVQLPEKKEPRSGEGTENVMGSGARRCPGEQVH